MIDHSATVSATSEGIVGAMTVPQLLAKAWHDRQTAILRLSDGRNWRLIHIHDGSPTAIELSTVADAFALMLEESELISSDERADVEDFARKKRCPQATAVLALRLIDAKEVYAAVRDQTRNQLGETLSWQKGEFRWNQPPKDDEPKGKPHDILKLLQQQLPTRWGPDRLFQALLPHSKDCADIAPRFRRVTDKLAHTSALARKAIDSLDGNNPIGQILSDTGGDPLAAATLWTLLHAGILRVGEKRSSTSALTSEVEFEVEVTETNRATNAVAKGASDSPEEGAPVQETAKAQALRVEIGDLKDQLADLDYYEALGLTTTASPAEIKRAYFKSAKKFHPDTLARLGLNDLRVEAAGVFARITEAFGTLSDKDKRALYDAGGRGEPEIDTAKLAQAEKSFRKGEILLRMGNFQGALEYLESAVDLWPEEPAYQSGLGWALYKQPKPDTARAREHLETASSGAPDDAVNLFRLGVVMRALGESDEGDGLIARARGLDPSVGE